MTEGFFERVKKAGREIRRTLRIAPPQGMDPPLYGSVARLTQQERKTHLKEALEREEARIENHPDRKRRRKDALDLEPRFIARGGEHLVFIFENPKHRDVVYKVNYHKSRPFLRAYYEGEPSLEQGRRDMIKHIKDLRDQRRELRAYFGFQAVPVVADRIRDVPVNLETIAILDPQALIQPDHLPKKLPALVSIQRKINLPPGEGTVSLTGYYPEASMRFDDIEHAQIYNEGHEVLTGGYLSEFDPDMQKRHALNLYGDLRPVDSLCQKDKAFKQQLQDAVRRMIQYVSETGHVLDLAGKNNVVLYQTSQGWQLKLIDPFLFDGTSMEDLDRAAKEILKPRPDGGEALPDFRFERVQRIMNALNTVRVINALAIIADIPERVSVLNLDRIPPHAWVDLLRRSQQSPERGSA